VASHKEQFEAKHAHKPKPVWVYGDRVFARVGKIPVVGMVIREDYTDPKLVLCHLDLPLLGAIGYNSIVWLQRKTITRLKEIL